MTKTAAIVFGAIFVLMGLLGMFVPNPLVGPGALFDTNTLHDGVHLFSGALLLAVAFAKPSASGLLLKVLGIDYLALALVGFVFTPMGGLLFGLAQVNAADHWLHVVLGLLLLVAGFMGKKRLMSSTPLPSSAI